MNLRGYIVVAIVFLGGGFSAIGQTNLVVAQGSPTSFRVVLESGSTNVLVRRAGATVFDPAYTGQILTVGDRVLTRTNSRLILIPSNNPSSILRFGPFADFEIVTDPDSESVLAMLVRRARLFFFSRGKPEDLRLRHGGASAATRGTEFEFRADDDDSTVVTVIDGEVTLRNEVGYVDVTNNQRGWAVSGKEPTKTSMIEATNIIQWCLYYPAVLDSQELKFDQQELAALKSSLAKYRAGDLLGAMGAYIPTSSSSAAEVIYQSALLLAVGRVEEATTLLNGLDMDARSRKPSEQERRIAGALKTLIAAVTLRAMPESPAPITASEWLAESYFRQSHADLKGALAAACQATNVSPNFGFAWARVAELEFSFAHTTAADEALKRALALSPSNAQAIALRGFVLAAKGDIRGALTNFSAALEFDTALGNAWLGRGLCRMRLGDRRGGQEDLLTAAAVEPQRSILRSYLGKAFADSGDTAHSEHEFDLAKKLDPNDPTAWFYSALLNQQERRYNQGISDLEKSQALNTNRSVYRSSMLLDQDLAVRGAGLAHIYRDAEMKDVSIREAARAVSYDYANYSAHLFLAQSYDALRDPTRFNLRYETPWFNELLLANLLSSVGGTLLSQNISQQEYSRLFDRNQVGLTSWTEYRSDGQLRELASQYGNIGSTAWALDLDYQHNEGVRPNNDLERIEWYTTIKEQLTPQDSVMLLAKYQDYHSGDNFQYYEPTNARPNFTFDEEQKPILVGGFHHEWSPGIHTLALGGRLENEQHFSDLQTSQVVLAKDDNFLPPHDPTAPVQFPIGVHSDVDLRSDLEIYDAELQQLFSNEHHTLIIGGRWQGGQIETRSRMAEAFTNVTSVVTNIFANAFPTTKAVDDFERWTAYAYETLKLPYRLQLTAGLTYDHLTYPQNFRSPPIQGGTETREQLSPKGGLVWEVRPEVVMRAVYARSLGGASLDESYQLEPSQINGFVQTFRTMIPESLVGSVSAPDHEVYGGALDIKLPTSTYIGLLTEQLNSEVKQWVGVFDLFTSDPGVVFPSKTRQHLDYHETRAALTLNQLISSQWSIGARYSFVRSKLDATYPDTDGALPESQIHADLHQVTAFVLFNHRTGFFAGADWNLYYQTDSRALVSPGNVANVPDETLQQINLSMGYRFPRQHGEIRLGILNLTDQDYRLNPVTPIVDLPRERVFYVQLRLPF